MVNYFPHPRNENEINELTLISVLAFWPQKCLWFWVGVFFGGERRVRDVRNTFVALHPIFFPSL